MDYKYQQGANEAMETTQRVLQEDKAADTAANPAALVETEDAREARAVLDDFLFEDILNNRINNEDRWGVTWDGDEYVLICHDTGTLYNFRVSILPGTLSEEEIKTLAEEQEWLENE